MTELDEIFDFLFTGGDSSSGARSPRPVQPFPEPSSSDGLMSSPATLNDLVNALPTPPDVLLPLDGAPGQPELPAFGIGLVTVSKTELADADSGSREPLKEKARLAEEAAVHQEAKVSSKNSRKRPPKKNFEKHREAERKRRLNFNRKIQALKLLLPYTNKFDTASILDEAAKYMKSLKVQAELQLNSQSAQMGLRMDHQGVSLASDAMTAAMAMANFPLLQSSDALSHPYSAFPIALTPPWPNPAQYLPRSVVQLPPAPFSQQHGGSNLSSSLFPLPSTSLGTWLQEQQMPVLNQVVQTEDEDSTKDELSNKCSPGSN